MKIKYIIFAFIVVGLLFRVVQYQHALFSDWDEGIYAEVAADMVERNSYILPEFNSQPWLDKPPVVGILVAGAFKLFPGHKELASRATMAFVAIGLLAFLYILSKRITTFFFAEKLNSLSEWMRELVFFSPLFATALTPVFLDRAIRLNTDSLLAVCWLGYFVARESFQGKFAAIIIGTWTKSVAGFYPMVFDIFSFFTLKNKTKNIGLYIALIVSGFSWLILNYFVYGHDFIKAHIQDQLFKRVTVPIELHFGGRLFYPEFLVKELSFVLVIMICSYLIITFDILKKLRPENGIFLFKKLTSFIQSPSCALYVLLLSPLPFFVLLTFAKSKIWWYMILIIPFFALSIPYGLMRVRNNTLRTIVAISIFAFFLFRFLPATYALKTVQDSPDKLRVAQCVGSIPSDRVLIMVNEQERKNRNVVEAAQLQTYSSFMYGGAPSFIKFAIVGLLGFGVDFGVSAQLIHSVGIHTPTANALGAECAIIFNFFMNNYWSFKHKKIDPGIMSFISKLLTFNFVSSGAIVIQWVGITILIALFGEGIISIFGQLSLPSWAVYKIFLIACVIIPYSYVMYNRFIWKKS